MGANRLSLMPKGQRIKEPELSLGELLWLEGREEFLIVYLPIAISVDILDQNLQWYHTHVHLLLPVSGSRRSGLRSGVPTFPADESYKQETGE